MRKVRTHVFCDQCKAGHRRDALITCEIHSVDLCKFHIREHFDSGGLPPRPHRPRADQPRRNGKATFPESIPSNTGARWKAIR